MHSLRARLLVLWILSLAASVAVALPLLQLSQQSTEAQVERAEAVVARACDLIRDRYDFYSAGWTGPTPALTQGGKRLRRDLAVSVGMALARQEDVEGGIWQVDRGPLAYAFPTYQGSGPKTDLPAAERTLIQSVNEQAAAAELPVQRKQVLRDQTLLLQACPLSGPITGLTAWTMLRVHAQSDFGPVRLGLAVLLGLLLLMALWLGRTLLVWSRHVRGIEAALAGAGPDGLSPLPPTGERELDRIVAALNDAGRRLSDARRTSEALAARVGRAERLAGLGRVAAGVAHEIRNPIAAARLQGENGLAGDAARRGTAITEMLGQMDRLDLLVSELLAMTQRVTPKAADVVLDPFLAAAATRHRPLAEARSVRLDLRACGGGGRFDPALVDRVLDNLLANAIRHAPPGGAVILSADRAQHLLSFVVEDSGQGVTPDMRPHLFEPFATGRPDGTGLGLAIARELADAHGGTLALRRAGGEAPGQGAVFALELPQEEGWPAS